MPRNIPKPKKESWYAAHEAGTSVPKIAREAGSDPRTVQRAIDGIKEENAQELARREVRGEGLRRHQQALLDFIDKLIHLLGPISNHLALPHPAHEIPSTIPFSGGRIERIAAQKPVVVLDVESEIWWDCLRQHLKASTVLNAWQAWKRSIEAEARARLELRQDMLTAVRDEIGMHLSKSANRPGVVTPYGLHELEQAVIALIFHPEEPYPVKVWLDPDGTYYVNEHIAGRARREDPQLPTMFEALPGMLASRESGERLRQASQNAESVAKKARRTFEEIRAGFFVPGTCRSCKGG